MTPDIGGRAPDFDVDDFLAQPLMAHLATSSPAGPRNSPVWFRWEGGAIWLIGTAADSYPRRLAADPRCALGVVQLDLARGLLRHVGIRGTAEVLPLDADRLTRLLVPYLGPDPVAWDAAFRRSVIDHLDVMVRIEPVSMVVRDESYFAGPPR